MSGPTLTKLLTSIFLLGFATMPAAAAAPKREEIPLYLSATRALVMVRIGSHPPFPAVFDTGTNGNLVDLGLARSLGLPNTGPSPSIDGSTGKPVPGHDTFIKNARLGGVAIADARATALAYDQPDEIGIFGPNSFPEHFVEMDGPGSRLVLTPRTDDNAPPGPALPYADRLPSLMLEIGALRLPAKLDSGNDSALILPMRYKDQVALQAEPVRIGYAVSAAGRQPIFSARLKGALCVGPLRLEHPEIRFMEGGTANIGLAILRRLRVVYDDTGKRAWILPNLDPSPSVASGDACPDAAGGDRKPGSDAAQA